MGCAVLRDIKVVVSTIEACFRPSPWNLSHFSLVFWFLHDFLNHFFLFLSFFFNQFRSIIFFLTIFPRVDFFKLKYAKLLPPVYFILNSSKVEKLGFKKKKSNERRLKNFAIKISRKSRNHPLLLFYFIFLPRLPRYEFYLRLWEDYERAHDPVTHMSCL